MKRHPKFGLLSAVLLIALALNGAFPHPAMADEPLPPPPDTSEPAPAEPPPSEPPAESTAESTTESTTEPTAEAAPVASTEETDATQIVEALPPETNLVVLDANGVPMPLASTDAALALATGDPMWCPEGSAPGGGGCIGSATFNGVGGLLDVLQNNPVQYSGPGTIYVAFNYTTALEGGAIVIDGTLYTLTDLTIQGGWDFGPDNKVVGTTTFEEALQIINWDDDVTLNDLVFDGNSTGETENLLVETTGDIELNNVESKNNTTGAGAKLDNTAGSGSIEVNSSDFHNNLTIGIQALSNNGISLYDVDASSNDASGAVLDNCQAAVSCSATFAGSVYISYSTFNGNGEDGLSVASNGYIQTIDITANQNGQSTLVGSGMVLDNSLADDPQSVTVGYLNGSEFNDNLENGLTVLTKGDVTVYQATANGNGHTSDWAGAGAYLDNTFGSADTFVYNFNIYTDQYGEFNDNYADGLDVRSNGNVELWYIRAEDNGTSGNAANQWGMGTYIDNCNWNGSSCDGTGWVEVNHSDLNSNYSAGLYIRANGDIDLTDVTTDDNGNFGNTSPDWAVGTYLNNCILDGSLCDGSGDVTISGGEFGYYVGGGNYGDGLQVYSSGDVYLEFVFADDNGQGTDLGEGNGAVLDACLVNAGACAGSGSVTVVASEFSGNYSNGLSAFASSDIMLDFFVAAEDNGDGLNVGFGTGALLVNNYLGSTGAILLYGPITLNNNIENGLIAESNSDILIASVDASDNGGFGAAVTTTNGSVSIDLSTFSSNDEYGVLVSAVAGDVTANDLEASDNGSFGAAFTTTVGSVSIDQGLFNSNTSFGLSVNAGDDVGLADLSANGNGGFGASIVTTAGGIMLDLGRFNTNTGFGLNLSSPGAIDVVDVEATGNGGFGAAILTGAGALVTGGDFLSNTGFGLNLSAGDDVSLSDVNASDNGVFGGSVVTTAGGISIDTGIFDSNTGFGLNASGVDQLVLNDVDANDNGVFGATLSSSSADVTVYAGNFNSNSSFGLNVSAVDQVGLSDVVAGANGAFGANLTSTAGPVWIDGAAFNSNTAFGLNVSALSDVSLANVSASDNGTYGAQIVSGAGSVSIDPSYFNSNGAFGLGVVANDGIDLEFVQASDNTAYGADLSSTTGGLMVGDSAFDGNGSYGLVGAGPGNVSLGNVSASSNSGFGADLATNGNLSLADSYFSHNTGGAGLTTAANGSTTLNDVGAEQNTGIGADIASGNEVSIRAADFNGNSATGVSILAGGQVKLDLVDAVANGLTGADITTGSNVFVNPSYFTWNGGDGLHITAGGSVSLHEIYASSNAGAGANVTAPGGITVTGGYFNDNVGDGLNLVSGGDIIVECITALGNGGYGIDANLPGHLKTKGNTLADNAAGDLNVSGGGSWHPSERTCEGWPHWDTSGLPWQVFHVTNGDSHALDCTLYGGTVLILPSWDHVSIPCPITGDASLVEVPSEDLPGELGDNYTYVSGLDTEIKPAPDGELRIDFLVPPAYLDTNLIVMHWDGSQWVDRGGFLTSDNFFEIASREGGVYVLVSQ